MHEGNVAIMGPRTHGAWLGSVVFDGARAFEGVTPDLDLHFERVNELARRFLLKPSVSVESWLNLARDGLKRFDAMAELYIRPMYWADLGTTGGGVRFDPNSTRWCLCLYEAAMPKPERLIDHAFAIPASNARMRAGRRQGKLQLSQQRAGA